MNRQVVYLMSGRAHLPYLLVGLRELRKHWAGDVTVFAWPESYPIAKQIAAAYGAECVEREPKHRLRKNSQFLDKIRLMRTFSDDTTTLYLDADTTPAADLTSIFQETEMRGFCATQFNKWVSTGGIVRKRVKRLADIESIDQRLVQWVLTHAEPSVNGGVFASKPNSPVLKLWEEWTWDARNVFIADETVLHVLSAHFAFPILRGGAWNCSPKYQPDDLADEDVKIWHFHGDSNVRPEKSQKGYDYWWPLYEQCLQENIADVRSWIDAVVAENKHMRKLEKPCVH